MRVVIRVHRRYSCTPTNTPGYRYFLPFRTQTALAFDSILYLNRQKLINPEIYLFFVRLILLHV